MNRSNLFYLLSFIFISCNPVSPLEQALRMSGDNREQLEQVLKHYSLNQEDSLKYKAACYLITHMPGHGWYEGREPECFKRWIDSVYHDQDFIFRATLQEAFFQQPRATEGLKRYEDIENLDSSFLITYIDSTFSAIRKRPWLSEITFEQLCEYVLPYRVGHERPRQLFKLQDSVFKSEIADILCCNDIYDAAKTFRFREPKIFETQKEIQILYRGKYINYELSGCVCQAMYRNWRAKLMLFPVVTDLTPAYPNQNNRHCWSAMIVNTLPHHISCLTPDLNTLGKIYRKTYSRNPKPDPEKGEFIPPFFRNPFYRDVTSSYNQTEDIQITPGQPISTSYAYLCVFNDLDWKPVAYTRYEKGQFSFPEVARGVAYLPVTYPEGKVMAISYPFILDHTGRTHTLQPDTSHLMSIKLDRKYPLSQAIKFLNSQFLFSVIEASNDPLFNHKDSIGIFQQLNYLQWTSAKTGPSGPYRYWRIRGNNPFIIAECHLYNQAGKCIKPIPSDTRESLLYQSAFDDDPLSYATSFWNSTFTWDMGETVVLSGIECLLYNDGNNIWPGHWYELFYHDGTNWNSLGLKEATDRFIEFTDVPANTLLWLKNLTTGKEERIFTYKNGQVRFW